MSGSEGELQGAIASLYGLSSILGPPLMTQVFGYFSAPTARVNFPGAPFATAAMLNVACAVLFVKSQVLAPPAIPPIASISAGP